jgi:glutamate synthase (NADPH) large chain
MISRHYHYTNSTVAKFILNDFENQLKNFVKVFPKDYKRVLSEKTATNLPLGQNGYTNFLEEIKVKK